MSEQELMVTGVKPSSVALFEGVFGAIIGLAVSVLYLLGGTIVYSDATNSLLQGLLIGFTIGAMSLLVLPIVYFAIGWLIGYVNGYVFNLILRASGGISVDVAAMQDKAEQGDYPVGQDSQVFGERIDRHDDK